MAATDHTVNVNMVSSDKVLAPGDNIEFDAVADDRWAASIAAGWVSAAASDSINEPDEVANPDWPDPTP